MITGAAGRQTHSLLDLKKQQWAKEREEIARLDEIFSSSHHHSSTSHQKIERTSIRTFYSNLDLRQTSSIQSNAPQEKERKRFLQYQSQPPVHRIQGAFVSQQHQQMRPPEMQRDSNNNNNNNNNNNSNNELDQYIDIDHQETAYDDDGGDFENDGGGVALGDYGRLSRSYECRQIRNNNNNNYNANNRLPYFPGQRNGNEVVEPMLRTAKPRLQNHIHAKSQRVRSPSLPVIKQRDYVLRHQQQLSSNNNNYRNNHPNNNNNNNNNNNSNNKLQQMLPSQQSFQHQHPLIARAGAGAGSAVVIVHPGNTQQNRPNIVGCLEEDTSGYLSDSPKNTHTPDIWFNDGASRNESSGGMDTAETLGTSSTGSQGREGEGQGIKGQRTLRIARKPPAPAPPHYQQHSNHKDYGRQQQQQTPELKDLQEQEEILNSTYVIEGRPPPPPGKLMSYSNTEAEDNNGYQGSFYISPSSSIPSNFSRDVSTSNTYAIHPIECTADSYTAKSHEERERAKWNAQSFNGSQYHQQSPKPPGAPGWLSRGPHDAKDSGGEDDTLSIHSSHLRGQNAPIDPVTLAERMDKRRKAAEYHNAIKQQLQERELIRKWEHERHLQEERLEEQRIRREKHLEKERLELERRQMQEREEIQRKKQQMMAEAIAKAEAAARMEREKRRRKRATSMVEQEVLAEATAESTHRSEKFEETPKEKEGWDEREQHKSVEEVKGGQVDDKQDEILEVSSVVVDHKEALEMKEGKPIGAFEKPQEAHTEEEQVLIGTPINLRTTTKKPQKPTRFGDCQEAGTLILQPATLIPLPITTDIFGLQTAIGNLQIATYLMQQQQQQLKAPLTAASTKTSGETQRTNETDNTIVTTTEGDEKGDCLEETAIETTRSCKRCGKGHSCCGRETQSRIETIGSSNKSTSVEKDEFDDLPKMKTEKRLAVVPAQTQQAPPTGPVELLQDVATQTELPLNCDLCLFHDNFYKVLLKREVSTTTTTQTSKKTSSKRSTTQVEQTTTATTAAAAAATAAAATVTAMPEKEHDEMTTTTTTTTTTTFKAKSKDSQQREKRRRQGCAGGGEGGGGRKDNRPKWGVNQPMVQYVKASDRDPFYMRHKKKTCGMKAMRSLSVDSHLDTVTGEVEGDGEEEEEDEREGFLLKARNVCTEILPIKTDEKGRIFLNFREASAIMNEDEIKEKLREKYFSFGRVLPRRSWASATQRHGSHFKGQGGDGVAGEGGRGGDGGEGVSGVGGGRVGSVTSSGVGDMADD